MHSLHTLDGCLFDLRPAVMRDSEAIKQAIISNFAKFCLRRDAFVSARLQLRVQNCLLRFCASQISARSRINLENLIATEQSLWAFLSNEPEGFKNWAKDIQVLVIDECHHVNTAPAKGRDKKIVANTWWEVAMAIPATYRFGVSATLNTEDSPNNQFVLESVTGKVIYYISVSELIKRKVLVPMQINMIRREAIPCRVWKTREIHGEVVDGAYDINIIDADDRNRWIAQIANNLHKQGRKVLVLVDLVGRHGEFLAELIPNSVFLSGKHKRNERDEGIEQFVKQNKVLISTIVKEGFDVPAIDAVIIAGGGKSHKMLIQKLGRARRITPGKSWAEVWDFYDDDGESSMGPRMCARHSEERLKIYKSGPEDVLTIWKSLETAKGLTLVNA